METRAGNGSTPGARTFVAVVSELGSASLERSLNVRLAGIEAAGGQVVDIRPYVAGEDGAWETALVIYQAAGEVTGNG